VLLVWSPLLAQIYHIHPWVLLNYSPSQLRQITDHKPQPVFG
jgi:hypothetical protein